MYQNLRVAFNSLVKFLISRGSLINADLVRDNEAGVCSPRNDHIAQVSVVFLDVALAGANCKTLMIFLHQHRAGTATSMKERQTDLLEQLAETH